MKDLFIKWMNRIIYNKNTGILHCKLIIISLEVINKITIQQQWRNEYLNKEINNSSHVKYCKHLL